MGPRPGLPRRTLLRRLGQTATVALLAGCTTAPEPDPGQVGEHTTPPGGTSFPSGPKSPPDLPDDLTEENVGEYAREYERRYVYNLLWMGEGSTVGVACEIDSVETVDDGYRVDVSCFGSAKQADGTPATENGTTTEVVADYFETPATYYVDADTTIRQGET